MKDATVDEERNSDWLRHWRKRLWLLKMLNSIVDAELLEESVDANLIGMIQPIWVQVRDLTQRKLFWKLEGELFRTVGRAICRLFEAVYLLRITAVTSVSLRDIESYEQLVKSLQCWQAIWILRENSGGNDLRSLLDEISGLD